MDANESEPVLVVCDAGPLIHLHEIECLDLLAGFAEVLVPEAVWREVAWHRPAALDQTGVRLRRLAPGIAAPPKLEALRVLLSLDIGECEALGIALEQGADLLLTDDTAARLAAGQLGITARGTIGILIRAIRKRTRTKAEVLSVLESLPTRSSLHLRRSFLQTVIEEVRRDSD